MLNYIFFGLFVLFVFCTVSGIVSFLIDVYKYRQPFEKVLKHCSADEVEADAELEASEHEVNLSPEELEKREEVKKIANSIFDSFGN